MQKTTKGWKLLVIWKDQSKTWIPLKYIKESNLVEVTEFSKAWCIVDEPAFCWWVPYILRKRDYIILAVKSRVRKTTHKYSIEIPKSREEVFRFDKKNGNIFWSDALHKEMNNLGNNFEILDKDTQVPVG